MGNNVVRGKLYRSIDDCIIAGVCAGVAEYFGLDVSLVRIAAAILFIFGGLSLWVYIIMWIIVPKAPHVIGNNNK